MPDFIPGLELSRLYFEEAVRPILNGSFPDLAYSAARIDGGSDVLGYDTPMSTDHDWGPRLMLFLPEADFQSTSEAITTTLAGRLPPSFLGLPTGFVTNEEGSWLLDDSGPSNHRVTCQTIRGWFDTLLRIDPFSTLTPVEWLTCAEQSLRTTRSGAVYHDGLGQLEPVREKLHYYPHDVWLYLLACQWARIGQEEHFVGRCGVLDDDLGSRIIATRLAVDVMRLCFLMQKQYAPYPKWFGTAFKELEATPALLPHLEAVLAAQDWKERESHLSTIYEHVASRHNALGLTDPLPESVSQFHGRPFMVIQADVFVKALREQITDPAVLALPASVGSVDQLSHSTDILAYPNHCARLRSLYE